MAFVGWKIPTAGKGTEVALECEAPIVHLSSATLVGKLAQNAEAVLFVEDLTSAGDPVRVAVASLSNSHRCQSLDIFVAPDAKLHVESAGSGSSAEVHVAGYVEDGGIGDDSEEDSEVDSQEGEEATAAMTAEQLKALIQKHVKKAGTGEAESDESDGDSSEEDSDVEDSGAHKVNETSEPESEAEAHQEAAAEQATAAAEGEASSSSEDEAAGASESEEESGEGEVASDSESESGDSSHDDSASDSSEEEDEEVHAMEEKPVAKKPVKETKDATKVEAGGKKRKATAALESQPPSKKEKTPTPADSTPEGQYQTAITEFLKSTGGSSLISMIGCKVKRPAGMKAKLGAFFREKADIFEVTGQTVQLRK